MTEEENWTIGKLKKGDFWVCSSRKEIAFHDGLESWNNHQFLIVDMANRRINIISPFWIERLENCKLLNDWLLVKSKHVAVIAMTFRTSFNQKRSTFKEAEHFHLQIP